ncbi:MAG: tyrosinase family protein [Pseudomonadota bacterium]
MEFQKKQDDGRRAIRNKQLIRVVQFLSCMLLTTFVGQAALAQTAVEIELHNTASAEDDFLCWSPVKARVRLAQTQSSDKTVSVSGTVSGNGRLQFSAQSATSLTSNTYSPNDQINIELPANGGWVELFVSGSKASDGSKDVSIRVAEATSGSELGLLPVMVRVRKNANNLSQVEKSNLLNALASLNGHQSAIPTESYEKYANAHRVAFEIGIHQGHMGWPLFLAWHRAFLLSLERELQQIDPTVTIPYWRFDEDNSNIFTPDFMGTVAGSTSPFGTIVQFSQTNPMLGWRMTSGGTLTRLRDSSTRLQNVYPPSRFQLLHLIMDGSGANEYGGSVPANGINSQLERRHHNYAHDSVRGWLGSGASPRDPLFFLLHANVDRAWAEWQAKLGKFNKSEVSAYSAQGAYPGSGGSSTPFRKSSYAQDVMWPWSQDDGSSTPNDSQDNWPSSGFAFLPSPSGFAPVGDPTPASMIDYLGMLNSTDSTGFCYDHINYFGEVQ